jgi:microcystin-dependent protein
MQASNIPVKLSIPWANSAGSSYIRTVPEASRIGIQNGAASLTDGFPPWTMGPGGFPFGQDFNGILKQITQWLQWTQAGAPVQWDSAFSAAIGGYPAGALILKLNTPGAYWYSTVDNNVTNPDTGGAGWATFGSGGGGSSNVFGPFYGVDTGAADAIVATMSPTLSSYIDGQIFEITPVATNLTTTPVANLSSLGNKSIIRADGTALLAGEIVAGAKQLFAYDQGTGKIVLLGISPKRLAAVAQAGAGNWVGNFGGGVNALTGSVTPAVTALTAGLIVSGLTVSANTGAANFTLNGIGPTTIIRDDGVALIGGEMNGLVELEYDGTAWRIISMLPMAFIIGALGNAAAPPGKVDFFAMASAPTGWLQANGAAVSRSTYANLFAAIGTIYGAGDGLTTFTLPDLRGEFIRGWDNGSGVDPARVFGSTQADAFASHTHSVSTNAPRYQSNVTPCYSENSGSGNKCDPNVTLSIGATGGAETRPKNVAMLVCIKY